MGPPEKPITAEKQILSLGRVLQKLREENNVDSVIETTISYIKEQFNYQLIWIAFYDRLNHILFGKGGITPTKDSNFLQQRLVLSPGDLLEQVVIEQRPLGLADLRAEHRAETLQEAAKKFRIQGTIILPIRHKDRCLGLVLMGSQNWGYVLAGEAKARLSMVLGELGAVLYQHQMDLQQKQTKRSEGPLLQLLSNLGSLSNLDQKLEAVVKATHQFVSPSRTNIYWFVKEGRYFWCRMSNQLVNMSRNSSPQPPAVEITVQELSEFYYALSVNQIVWIGESRSSLNSHFTGKLLQRLRVRSLLAAPIIWQKDLLGFLAVESNQPRIWVEADKNFVQGAAGLISLVAPTENMESTIQQIQEDAQLTSQVARAIYSEHDLHDILHICAEKVLDRLAATRFLLLWYNSDQNNYEILFQSQLHNRRTLTFTLNVLKEMDRQLLQYATAAVEIQNLDEDLRFFNWRPSFLENNVHSLLVSNCTQGHAPAALLVIAHETHRSWTTLEKELLWVISQQIGVMIRQWLLQASAEQQKTILHSFQQCLRIFAQTQSKTAQAQENHLESTALQQIASILSCPLAIMLSWSPGQHQAEIIPGVIANTQFGIVLDTSISIQTEALIQWALTQDGPLRVKVDDLPLETREWLNGPGIGQILVMVLRTSTVEQPTGVVLLADHYERLWSEQSLSVAETLVCQLAWSHRQKQITHLLESTTKELQQLNWYKHRSLEEVQRAMTLFISQINDLDIPANEITQTRYQQLLRQLDYTTASITGMLKLEHWQLQMKWETIPVASLLKRAVDRVDNLLKQHKLWVGVHGLGQLAMHQESLQSSEDLKGSQALGNQSPLAISGDIAKIELVLHELLVIACHRSHSGGRIDIWCRRLDERTLDLSITDNGIIEPQLLAELQQDTAKDWLAPSILDQPPGLHLLICQNLIQQLKGELHFYQLPDHRVVSRLLLLLADHP
ncbi:MAG: GAF domain-containing protein [Mojavia pulchra JT2-VF2]|uniref:GAF domain-containing protein n=1 Tax=Mojavia pulchra JT2-VF2 TaxID=287848 RepID=A0A951PTQ2_9NOST|nr:GAF domain-containing protein [Mojavia pulchra JT2-VF2]